MRGAPLNAATQQKPHENHCSRGCAVKKNNYWESWNKYNGVGTQMKTEAGIVSGLMLTGSSGPIVVWSMMLFSSQFDRIVTLPIRPISARSPRSESLGTVILGLK